MKLLLIVSSLLAAVLNFLSMVSAFQDFRAMMDNAALGLAVVVFLIALYLVFPRRAGATTQAPAVAAPPPAPAANQAKAEVVAFFGLLQEKGRFVDFLMEDILSFDDAQVAAASRVVHQGCQAVLKEHFRISPVADTPEGSQVTVPAGYAADEYRLLGKITGEAPFTGTLIHKGWKTESVKLPRLLKADDTRLPAIAPAEVELK